MWKEKLLKYFEINRTVIGKQFINCFGFFTSAFGLILAFFTWEDLSISNVRCRIYILIGIAVFSIVYSVIRVFFQNEKSIFGDANKGVSICCDDLMEIGFPKGKTSEKIIVIPVNRCFDLTCEDNLIAPSSIHGQWLDNYIKSDGERNYLYKTIQDSLDSRNIQYETLEREKKKAGYLKRYLPGTVVELKQNNGVTFYLLAYSSFDSDLIANCSERETYDAVQGLLKYYNSHGQGVDMYCPVMGDHFPKPSKTTDEMIRLILAIFQTNKNLIRGKVHLVVYKKRKFDISIHNY